jgi:hypothetical protein
MPNTKISIGVKDSDRGRDRDRKDPPITVVPEANTGLGFGSCNGSYPFGLFGAAIPNKKTNFSQGRRVRLV